MSFFTKLFKKFDINSARVKLAELSDALLERIYENNLGSGARKPAENIRRLILTEKFDELQFDAISKIFDVILNESLNEDVINLYFRKIKSVLKNNDEKELAIIDGEIEILKLRTELKEMAEN